MPTSVCDLGSLCDDEDPRRCVLYIVNAGADTVGIVNVRSSCGCLRASARADLLLPGDTVDIVAEFSPRGMLGTFDKTVDVVTTDARHRLHIRGNVMMSPSSIERRFTVVADSMRFSTAEVAFGSQGGSIPVRCVSTYAGRNTAVVITQTPQFIKAKALLDPIPPGQMCTILVESDPRDTVVAGATYPIHLQVIDADTAVPLASLIIQVRYD